MADMKEKKNVTSPDQAATAGAPSVNSTAECAPKNDKLGGRVAFNLFNFLGMHWVANSTLSLWITYNILPTRPAQGVIETLSKWAEPVAGFFSRTVKEPIKKAFTATFGKKFEALTQAEKSANIAHSARSAVEVACMCIAGSVILFPVKWLEDHRTQFVNTADKILHPFRKAEPAQEIEKQHTQSQGKAPQPGEHHETWGNLIRARLVSLVPIFFIDSQVQKFNNARYKTNKSSVDSVLWKAGADIFENNQNGSKVAKMVNATTDVVLPKTWRESVLNFFSRKKITVANIQDMVRGQLMDIVGSPEPLKELGHQISEKQKIIKANPKNKDLIKSVESEIESLVTAFNAARPELQKDVKKAIFAEQTRLFAKEWYLTLIYTGFLFVVGKTKIVKGTLDKCGEIISKPFRGKRSESYANAESFSAPVTETPAATDLSSITLEKPDSAKWSAREENQPKAKIADAPAASFAEAALQKNSPDAAVSV